MLRPSRIFNPFSRSSGCKHLFFDISSCWRAPASRQQLAGGRRGTRRAWLICCSSLRCLPFSSLFFGRIPLRNLAPRVLLASIPSTPAWAVLYSSPLAGAPGGGAGPPNVYQLCCVPLLSHLWARKTLGGTSSIALLEPEHERLLSCVVQRVCRLKLISQACMFWTWV